jgi:cell division protein FtsZ
MFAISDVMEDINNILTGNPEIIFGTTTDNSMDVDEIKITIVATGFESSDQEEPDQEDSNITPVTQVHVAQKSSNDENYYDTPPLMRGYSIKYKLA